ncbi:MAG: DNA repair protein RadC [Bacillota bacterium]|nr:DNA repair protein RadC [Bacillota bacterium]
MVDKNPHGSHRERVREKYLQQGFEGWHEHEVLEMLLFNGLPRVDTNPLAHALLDEFGTLAQVLDADVTALMKVPGIAKNTAIYLNMLGKLQGVYCRSKWHDGNNILPNSTAVGLFCVDYIGNEIDEVVAILCLDSKKSLKKAAIISKGIVDRAPVHIRKIAEVALSVNARFVVLCHNHPSGNPNPSGEDKELTRMVSCALAPLNIDLIDHIVVGGKSFISMAEAGIM